MICIPKRELLHKLEQLIHKVCMYTDTGGVVYVPQIVLHVQRFLMMFMCHYTCLCRCVPGFSEGLGRLCQHNFMHNMIHIAKEHNTVSRIV